MRAVVQRVSRAEVRVGGEVVGRIGRGLVVLLGVMRRDEEALAARLADKLVHFRCFPEDDDEGEESAADGGRKRRMDRSLVEVGGACLVVSQVTLAADGRKGRRPSLDAAAPPALAEELYRRFASLVAEHGVPVATGSFGALMEVELVGDGPVTFVFDETAPGTPDERGRPSQVLA